MNEDELTGINANKEPIEVKHADLERSGESAYRSVCPSCKAGYLLVKRDQTTFEILSEDNCILCGQQFVYMDLGVTPK